VLGLAGLLLAVPAAAGGSWSRHALTGDRLTVQLSGGERVGAWRIRLVPPGGDERTDFIVRAGDIAWSAVVRHWKRSGGRWLIVDRQLIVGTPDGLAPAGGENGGLRWHSADFRLPRDGDGRFAVTVELTADGDYRAVCAVREAVEAFSYGPWQRLSAEQISR
jgi:hypothetical protein